MDKQNYIPKVLSSNTNHAIGDIIAAAQILEGIYCAEIDALKKPDTRAFMELQSIKVEAAQNYYCVMTQMIERKNELAQVDAVMKKKLHEMHKSFSNTTEQNMQVMKRMQRYTARLGDTLRKAAVKAAQKNNTLGYSKNGELPSASSHKAISSGLYETV
jgi:uncharacterized coiled-coil DUF342 family protein